ncbi:MAG: Hypothetical protein AJITA_00388 [Acetilactobacillus jinshanensis]
MIILYEPRIFKIELTKGNPKDALPDWGGFLHGLMIVLDF